MLTSRYFQLTNLLHQSQRALLDFSLQRQPGGTILHQNVENGNTTHFITEKEEAMILFSGWNLCLNVSV